MIAPWLPGNGPPWLCAILASAARRPSETGAENHGSKKIVRHQALLPPQERQCDAQTFRIIQPGTEKHPEDDRPQEKRSQVFDQKALDHGPEERVARDEHAAQILRAQEDRFPPQDWNGAEAREARPAGGEDDRPTGCAPG